MGGEAERKRDKYWRILKREEIMIHIDRRKTKKEERKIKFEKVEEKEKGKERHKEEEIKIKKYREERKRVNRERTKGKERRRKN